jgi:hypothetical protein
MNFDKELLKKVGTRVAESVVVMVVASLANSAIEKGVSKVKDLLQKKKSQ